MPRGKQQNSDEIQDFSKRYPGGQEVDVKRGGWHEFKKIGDDLVGEFQGVEPFRNGMKGTIRKPNGELVVFSCASQLRDLLRSIKVGERIAIVLAGFQESSTDNPMKVYQVFRV